jgi:hypothetical protein
MTIPKDKKAAKRQIIVCVLVWVALIAISFYRWG